jgi:hypothetical protein
MKTTVHYVRPLSVALLTALSITFSGSVFAVAGKFQFVNGEVQVIDTTGKPRLAQKGGAIDEGETVSSSGNGFAQIKMEDGGFFAVRPDTEFKVDTFQFNGKEDGSEKGVFSLIKGSLRSVTGLIGKKHKDNYKIQTATSTIGIRGSGADVGHSDTIGTAVRTLFGGHSLTSGGKTIVTGPGQTALAPPGQAPGYVANFPFNTATAPGGNGQGEKNEGNGAGGKSEQQPVEKQGSNKADKPEPLVVTDQKVVIPIKDTEGNDYTKNEDTSGGAIGRGFTGLPAGTNYVHYITALKASGAGYIVAEQGAGGYRYSPSNYTFDSNGMLVGVASSELKITDASYSDFDYGPSSLTVLSGAGFDAYHTPDNSIFIGRGSNLAVNTTCTACSGTDNFISAHFLVGLATPATLVQTLTGTTNYALAGSTHPTDAFGNVGTLNSAYLTANFTNQTVGFNVDVTIASKNLVASGSNIPILDNGFDAKSVGGVGNLTVTCTGACTGANASVGGGFFGNAGASAALGYAFWPLLNTSAEFTDYVHGIAAFTAGAPTAIPSVEGVVGGGGAAVGVGTLGGPEFVFNDFNIVGNSMSGRFSARHDLNGNLIAFTKSDMNQDLSFSLGAATPFPGGNGVKQDGIDPSLGVVWGRWGSGYTANVYNNVSDNSGSLLPIHKLAFITGSHITSVTELAALPGLGVTTATYNLASGMGNFPTIFDGVSTGAITAASATVNFSTNNITAFSVSGSGGGFGTWAASGSGSIGDFMSATGIALSGTCISGSGTCAPTVQPISGTASGGFVGTQAQGLISTIGLSASPTEHLGGAVYMKR